MENTIKIKTNKLKIVLITIIIVLIAVLGFMIYKIFTKKDAKKLYSEMQTYATDKNNIDWEALKKINPDIYAWINIPGTEISYPILQHSKDDGYYLNHNIDGSAGYPGCIYTEKINKKNFSDWNSLLYGHNMMDGSMFGSLKEYKDENFFDEHRTIEIYVKDKILRYKVFAAVTYSNSYIPYEFNIANKGRLVDFVGSLKSGNDINNLVKEDVKIDNKQKLITLSTCVGNEDLKRFLIVAEKIND